MSMECRFIKLSPGWRGVDEAYVEVDLDEDYINGINLEKMMLNGAIDILDYLSDDAINEVEAKVLELLASENEQSWLESKLLDIAA